MCQFELCERLKIGMKTLEVVVYDVDDNLLEFIDNEAKEVINAA